MSNPTGPNRFPLPLTLGIFLALTVFLAPEAKAQYETLSIAGYSYAQFSSSDQASIDLYNADEKIFAILIFLPEDDPANLPPAAKGADGKFRLYYKRARLGPMIDQLRHESPMVLRFWTGTGGSNTHVATMDIEPVGEAE